MLEQNIKESIIRFVIDSPEEENSKVAMFIAGMQDQKNIQNTNRGENFEAGANRPELRGGKTNT
ncbi:hypothetical protein AGMMS4952_19780 [Spirochaetia bacterium]|nr:hypothetical protein AGMMS4952_19780 [Spirochaetia bacterium]